MVTNDVSGPVFGELAKSIKVISADDERYIRETGCCPNSSCRPKEGRGERMSKHAMADGMDYWHCRKCGSAWVLEHPSDEVWACEVTAGGLVPIPPRGDDALGCDSFRPDNINPTEFRCRDCGEWYGMDSERAIPNGQWGVREGGKWCVVGCFCSGCWEARRKRYSPES